MANGDDFVKYLTERVVKFVETPKEVRRQKKAGRKEVKEQWQYRWFGMLPFAIRMWFGRVFKKK